MIGILQITHYKYDREAETDSDGKGILINWSSLSPALSHSHTHSIPSQYSLPSSLEGEDVKKNLWEISKNAFVLNKSNFSLAI